MLNERPIALHALAAGLSFAVVFVVGLIGVALSVTGGGGPPASWIREAAAAEHAPAPAAIQIVRTEASVWEAPPHAPAPAEPVVHTVAYLTADDLAGGPLGDDLAPGIWSEAAIAREIDRDYGFFTIAYLTDPRADNPDQPILAAPLSARPAAKPSAQSLTNVHTLVRNAVSVSTTRRPASANIAGKSSLR